MKVILVQLYSTNTGSCVSHCFWTQNIQQKTWGKCLERLFKDNSGGYAVLLRKEFSVNMIGLPLGESWHFYFESRQRNFRYCSVCPDIAECSVAAGAEAEDVGKTRHSCSFCLSIKLNNRYWGALEQGIKPTTDAKQFWMYCPHSGSSDDEPLWFWSQCNISRSAIHRTNSASINASSNTAHLSRAGVWKVEREALQQKAEKGGGGVPSVFVLVILMWSIM